MSMFPVLSTLKPRYNEVTGTMKITLLHQVSHYKHCKGRKTKKYKEQDQKNYLVIREEGFVISDLFIRRFHCTSVTLTIN